MINSQGKTVNEKFILDKEKERAYLAEVVAILDKRGEEGIMTDELLSEYKSVLIKYNMIPKERIK